MNEKNNFISWDIVVVPEVPWLDVFDDNLSDLKELFVDLRISPEELPGGGDISRRLVNLLVEEELLQSLLSGRQNLRPIKLDLESKFSLIIRISNSVDLNESVSSYGDEDRI